MALSRCATGYGRIGKIVEGAPEPFASSRRHALTRAYLLAPSVGPYCGGMRTLVLATLTWSLLSAAVPASAEEQDPATAEAVFLQARTAMESGRYADACPKFAESQRLDPAAGTLMNLATCEEKLGKLASAWQHWKEAIDSLGPSDDRVAFARTRVDDLEKKLPRLTITLSSAASPETRIFRDATELGAASQGAALPVDPGEHTVKVVAPGRLTETTTVSIGEAEQKQIAVHVGAVDPAAAQAGGASHGTRRKTLGWILAGVGAGSGVAAVVTSVLLIHDKNVVDSNCPNKACVNQTGLDAATSGKTLAVVNAVTFAGAALGLGFGAYFVLSGPRTRRAVAFAATAGPTSTTITCSGAF